MSEEIFEEIKNDISSNKVVIYIKGTKEQPMCGFSAHIVNMFNEMNVEFLDRDVLADNDRLRTALPQFSDWPTFPQIFVDGELVGGCDILNEMYEKGEIQKLLGVTA